MQLLKDHNFALLILPILIFSLGYMTLLSSSPSMANDQLIYFILGYILYLGVSLIDFRLYRSIWKISYFGVLGLLIFTYILGEVRFGSARWIDLGFTTIQPSEFAKIVLILTLASLISLSKESISSIKNVLKIGLYAVPLICLVLLQPDLGTSIVLSSIVLVGLFYAGISYWYFLIGFTVFGIFSAPIWAVLHDYQKRRILVFVNPELDVLGSGYNVVQSLIAVGSGGIFGSGFGRGSQSHLNFLPAHWTDFAFASFAEEWGLVGSITLITFFTALCTVLLYTAVKSEDSLGSVLSIGVFTVFFVQFIINVGMNLGVMPVTGIPLPLISYGGSSLLTSMVLLGISQSVWRSRVRRV
jgi:rod shape determining protein RodA